MRHGVRFSSNVTANAQYWSQLPKRATSNNEMQWFCIWSTSRFTGTEIPLFRYRINPVVKLEKLCKKLNFAYAIAHLFCRIGFFCSSPGWWTVPDMTWETADWFWSGCKAASQSRDCYPCTNVTRPVTQLREPKKIFLHTLFKSSRQQMKAKVSHFGACTEFNLLLRSDIYNNKRPSHAQTIHATITLTKASGNQ